MFRRSLLALLLIAALAAGFLGGRLTSSGQGTQIETLQQTVAQLSQKVEELETGIGASEELQDLVGRVADLEEGLRVEQATTSAQEAEIEPLNQTLAQLSQKIEELGERVVTAEELQGLAARVATLEEELRGQWEQRFAELRGELDELASTMAAGAERKLKIGYVDMARVDAKIQYLRYRYLGGEQFESALQVLHETFQQIGEQEGYDLIIQSIQWENDIILYPQADSITDLTDRGIEALEER